MNTKLITLLAIAITLIGLTGAASAYTYSDFGTVTLGYYTEMVYEPDNLQTIELPFGEITPGFWTEMVYTPGEGDDLLGTMTLGYYTEMVYEPDNLQTIELPFGEITPGFWTEMVYTPPGCTPIASNANVGSKPLSSTPWVGVPIPGLEERKSEVRELPEAYSLREDLDGTSMPGPYTPERFGP